MNPKRSRNANTVHKSFQTFYPAVAKVHMPPTLAIGMYEVSRNENNEHPKLISFQPLSSLHSSRERLLYRASGQVQDAHHRERREENPA